MRRSGRLIAALAVALLCAPGTFLRTTTGVRSDIAVVSVMPVATGAGAGLSGPLRQTGLWQLSSAHGWFGGFSALVTAPAAYRAEAASGTTLIAGSDRGWLLTLDLTKDVPSAVPGSFRFVGQRTRGRAEVVDLEALALDPATGTLWAAFENANLIERITADGRRTVRRPREMREWSANSGPETMERLGDGRFVMLAEGAEENDMADRPALLFPGDPLAPDPPLAFRFVANPDYAPVDAALLPDGKLLILLRRVKYRIPAQFDTVIALADPALIRPGQEWRARVIQRLSGPIYGENFEGITFVPDPADPIRGSIWLIADDNFSVFQRSLLLRFAWEGDPAPGVAAR